MTSSFPLVAPFNRLPTPNTGDIRASVGKNFETIQQRMPFGAFFDVRAYGARGDGVTNDTQALQAALNAAAAAHGGIVYLPAGLYLSGTLTIPGEISIFGAGKTVGEYATTVKLANGTNGSLFDMTGDTCYFVTIRDLKLEGNSAHQTGASYGIDGYRVNNVTSHDANHLIANVQVKDFLTSGMRWTGYTNGTLLLGVEVSACLNHGIEIGTGDVFCVGCNVHQNLWSGFYVTGVSCQFTDCKAWFNGANPAGTGLLNPWPGWVFRTADDCVLSSCSAQENYRDGYYIYQSDSISLAACIGDDNGITATSGAGSDTYAGLAVVASTNVQAVGFVSDDFRRRANPTYKNQKYGITVDSTSDYCTLLLTAVDCDAGNELVIDSTGGLHNVGVVNGVVATPITTVASTTARAGFSLTSGSAPTSPVDGEMWYDGTNVKFRVGGTTKTFTLT